MVNGAFFVPSGAEMSAEYAEASSVQPKPVVQIDQLTMYSGVFGDPRYSTIFYFVFHHQSNLIRD
jgi:pectate lyase